MEAAHSPTGRAYAAPSQAYAAPPPAGAPSHLLHNGASSYPTSVYPGPAPPVQLPTSIAAASATPDFAALPKQRKKRQPADPDNKSASAEQKERKPRKPREPRDPNEPPRKRAKKEDLVLQIAPAPVLDQRQPQQLQPQYGPVPSQPVPPRPLGVHPTAAGGRDGPALAMSSSDRPSSQSARPSTSGQRYDPIRAASAENASQGYAPPRSTTYRSPHSMSMILNNPPSPTLMSTPRQTLLPVTAHAAEPAAPSSSHTAPPVPASQSLGTGPSSQLKEPTSASKPVALAEKPKPEATVNGVAELPKKPAPALAQFTPQKGPPPLRNPSPPTISSQLLANGTDRGSEKAKEYAEVTNQCIVIEIPMTSTGGSYVNFMKEVEQKYGFDVAHPQVAEHRRRMKDMAAAGALLESGVGSGDEMNLEVSDAGSDVEMGGADDGSAPEGTTKGRRKQRNDYDKDDEFIDDTELAWEQQALASKDGYFVWSGPLVQAGDKTTIERADGTVKRGRGSGRGRGGSSRGDGTTGRTRGGSGRGSRGGNTVRKPRVTKADRARMENEKQERERMAATASKPSSFPGTTA